MPTQMHAEKHVGKWRNAIIWEEEKGDCGAGVGGGKGASNLAQGESQEPEEGPSAGD